MYLVPKMPCTWGPKYHVPGAQNALYLEPKMLCTWCSKCRVPGAQNVVYLEPKMLYTWSPKCPVPGAQNAVYLEINVMYLELNALYLEPKHCVPGAQNVLYLSQCRALLSLCCDRHRDTALPGLHTQLCPRNRCAAAGGANTNWGWTSRGGNVCIQSEISPAEPWGRQE